jgi:hypothetical protein
MSRGYSWPCHNRSTVSSSSTRLRCSMASSARERGPPRRSPTGGPPRREGPRAWSRVARPARPSDGSRSGSKSGARVARHFIGEVWETQWRWTPGRWPDGLSRFPALLSLGGAWPPTGPPPTGPALTRTNRRGAGWLSDVRLGDERQRRHSVRSGEIDGRRRAMRASRKRKAMPGCSRIVGSEGRIAASPSPSHGG